MPALPIYTTPAMRKLEELAAPASGTLMERAGAAAAEYARSLCGDTAKSVLVLAGPGNNGGDAFEVATHLKRWFFRVNVVFSGERGKLPKDALMALEKWETAGGTLLHGIPGESRFDLAVDGLFGIGLKRPLSGNYCALVEKLNTLGTPVLALDVPSGIDADTGAVLGRAVRASHTLTFIAHKPGLLTLDGPDHCGELKLDTLGLDPVKLVEPEGMLLDADILDRAITPRPRNFHKGLAGSVGVLGGAAGMVGAAVIAGRAALKCGAGRVYVGLLTPRPPYVDDAQPELMLRKPKELFERSLVDVMVAGMGDALAGMIAALSAQGAEPLQALLAGVYLHGAAADALVASGVGPAGITASEVIDRARVLLNRRG